MHLTDTDRRVPFRAGVFPLPATDAEPPRLYGVACDNCGARFAGRRVLCLQCGKRALRERLLSPRGRVSTFTVVHQKPPGAVLQPPYVIAQVALDDGPYVTSVLVDVHPADVTVGLPVEMTLIEVRRDDDGNSVVAHAFRPEKAAA